MHCNVFPAREILPEILTKSNLAAMLPAGGIPLAQRKLWKETVELAAGFGTQCFGGTDWETGMDWETGRGCPPLASGSVQCKAKGHRKGKWVHRETFRQGDSELQELEPENLASAAPLPPISPSVIFGPPGTSFLRRPVEAADTRGAFVRSR